VRPNRVFALIALLALAGAGPAFAQGFSFSQPENDDERYENEARQSRIAEQLSTPCRADLKGKKIMVVIGEQQSNGYIAAQQQNYGPHFQAINARLRALGLRTYTPEEIRRQIAQAEIDAYFRNDPDAALAASRKLGASFVLSGLITAQATKNPMMNVNQVSVNMGFTLTGSNGRIVSRADASSASYAGADVQKMALTLVNEKADEVVAQLYSDYCRNAGYGAPAKSAPR
jgi:acid stress-induced BolA-like protein IbaG/YrbA